MMGEERLANTLYVCDVLLTIYRLHPESLNVLHTRLGDIDCEFG